MRIFIQLKAPLFLLITVLILAWSNTSMAQDEKPAYTIYFFGDGGAANKDSLALQTLEIRLKNEGKKSTVVFLGDNIYDRGMVPYKDELRKEAEKIIEAQLATLKNHKGKAFIIPGNHDWAGGYYDGLRNVILQDEYISEYLNKDNVFLPKHGCPGPEEKVLSNDIVLILIDTQWWLHRHEKPEVGSPCDAKSDDEFLIQLSDMVNKHHDKHIIIAGHHPIYTYGAHGGKFPLKMHLFPLTAASKNLYLPLPIIGSIYPIYRGAIGDVQDLASHKNKDMRKGILEIFKNKKNITYVSGHEHSMQYIKKDSNHFIVSGSGSKSSWLSKNKNIIFGTESKGFARMRVMKDGNAYVDFIVPDSSIDEGKIVHSQLMHLKVPNTGNGEYFRIEYELPSDSMRVIGSSQYERSGLRKVFFGKNYRSTWSDSITVRVFDVSREMGGLQCLKRGGGMQTRSLRMCSPFDQEYVIRSVEKYAAKAIPKDLQNTFASDLVQDQISSSHPYAAIPIQHLAKAAGIYYTTPELVWVPEDPNFLSYFDFFANSLCLYEERLSGNQEHKSNFGNTKKIVSTPNVLNKIHWDNDNLVDQDWAMKTRLMDIYVGDWDRHDDQFRFAEFKDEDRDVKIYRAIPRDRDQAFFDNDGIIPWIAGRSWAISEIRGFHHNLGHPKWTNKAAKYFDRTFISEPDKTTWMAYVDTFKSAMTDEVIENAIKSWPKEIYKRDGDEIISKLKSRREQMSEGIEKYYLFLAKKVDVVGSDKHEQFEIEKSDSGRLTVRVYKINKEGEKRHLMYHRVFYESETSEIRLYGLEGDDRFQFSGSGNPSIKIRVIAGEGDDIIEDLSDNQKATKRTVYYDYKEDFEFVTDHRLTKRISNKHENNEYDREMFQYNVTTPLAYLGFNPDDGIYLGGGVGITTYGFRKDPYATKQMIAGNYAIRTGSFNAKYRGNFKKAVLGWDVEFNADINRPKFVSNFFGFGNSTVFDPTVSKDFYNLKYKLIYSELLTGTSYKEKQTFRVGIFYNHAQLVELSERFKDAPSNPGVDSSDLFSGREHAGLMMKYTFDTRDSRLIPRNGTLFNLSGRYANDLRGSKNFSQFKSDVAFYLTAYMPLLTTIATRVGATLTYGEFEFYQSAMLSGKTNLRGFKNDRFSGNHSFYHNTEVRIKLLDMGTYIINGEFGILGFFDYGRVWLKGESSSKWHRGYGGGIWLTPYNSLAITASYGISDEYEAFLLAFGFLF